MIDSLTIQPTAESMDWSKRFPSATPHALDLLKKMLQFQPRSRISAHDALQHAYLDKFHDPFVEREAPCKVHVCIPDTDKRSTNHYRERLYKEVEHFKKEENRHQHK